ncbi:MAG TPA: amidohydrolase family protein [Trueperaceae bacterium]|nr:amidohydrolase family protein [Trueperaceae bacterium]
MLTRTILRAEVVYNGLGTPREGGAVVVQDDGSRRQVVAVEALERARASFPDARVEDAGFAVSPPPVNAHTHLDLTDMPYSAGAYDRFIRAVIRHRREHGGGVAAARRGVDEVLAGGVRVIGDIVTDAEVMRYLLTHPDLSGVAYWEVIGPDPADAERAFDEARRMLAGFRALERPGGVRVGVSPHTPHTVSAPLLQRLAALARGEGLPMQIHVAESPDEVALHRRGEGMLAELLGGLGVAWRPSGSSPLGYLAGLGVLEARPTLVHMVQVDEDDVRAVQRADCAVVHCPRSNEALACGRFPWELYARFGVDVAFGTDSRGSSPSLSIIEEVAFSRGLHGDRANPRALVRAAVKGGYRALGMTPPRVQRGAPAEALLVWPVSST